MGLVAMELRLCLPGGEAGSRLIDPAPFRPYAGLRATYVAPAFTVNC